jgi:hypothetical protein
VALGAFSVGQEYAYRTLPTLLAQPLPRPRFLLAKAAALAPLLASLAVLARLMLLRINAHSSVGGAISREWLETNTILVPILGFCVAPWLTLIFRNAIAGVVFTLAIPAAVWLAINLVPALDGVVGVFDDARALSIFWALMLGASAFALVDGRRMFVTLEVTDGIGGISVAGTRRRHAASVTQRGHRRHPLAQLVTKELRLQRMTFALSVLYVLSWTVIVATDSTLSLGPAFYGMSVVFPGVTALFVGSLASAEERSLGTLAIQALQPLAAWKQWLVKVATALVLTVALTVLLPRILEWAHPLALGLPDWRLSGGFLAVMACSLYVSSLSTGALQALLLSMPLVALATPLFFVTTSGSAAVIWSWLDPILRSLNGNWTKLNPLLSNADFAWYYWSNRWLPTAVLCGLVALVIWLAAANHRSVEHGLGRLLRQLAWLVPCLVIGAVITGAAPALLLWFLATH